MFNHFLCVGITLFDPLSLNKDVLQPGTIHLPEHRKQILIFTHSESISILSKACYCLPWISDLNLDTCVFILMDWFPLLRSVMASSYSLWISAIVELNQRVTVFLTMNHFIFFESAQCHKKYQ